MTERVKSRQKILVDDFVIRRDQKHIESQHSALIGWHAVKLIDNTRANVCDLAMRPSLLDPLFYLDGAHKAIVSLHLKQVKAEANDGSVGP
jgi:hypothetical protein